MPTASPDAAVGLTAIIDPSQPTQTANPPVQQQGFTGLTSVSGPATSTDPPDPWVAVGPDHVVQTTNVSMRVTDRSGGQATAVDLASFFSLADGFQNTDPRVIYDSQRGRWLVTEVSWICHADDGNPYGYLDLLVSDTADPLGSYTLWYWEFQGYLPDFAALGSSSDKLGWGSNVYTIPAGYESGCMAQPGAAYYGADMLFFDWSDLLAGGGSNAEIDTVEFFNGDGEFSTPRVALQTPASSPALDLILEWTEDGITYHPYYVKVVGSVVDGTIEIASEWNLAISGVAAAWGVAKPPVQPGPDVVTDRIDTRPTDAIAQGSRLLFVSNQECLPDGDAAGRACVRVTELNTSGTDLDTPPSMKQDLLVAEAGRDSYFGGIGLAADGTLHVVWTASSATAGDYPSSYAAYQLPSDGPDTLSEPELLKAGTGKYPGNRWGDYVGVAQDPQVPNAVWQGNEYSGGANGWRTWVSQLQNGGSSYVPIDPVRVLDSRPGSGIGLAGAFTSSVPRTWKVGGFKVGGTVVVPANAVAVTGNFTVVGQTAAGYASITTTPNANPATSTLNFPLGDVRANNVTVPLSSTGTLSAVYRAGAGKTTQFLFDVTGYFLAGDTDATYATVAPVRVLDFAGRYRDRPNRPVQRKHTAHAQRRRCARHPCRRYRCHRQSHRGRPDEGRLPVRDEGAKRKSHDVDHELPAW